MRRLLLVVATVVAWALGIGLVAVGLALLVTFGSDGRVSTSSGQITGKGAALVSDGDAVSGDVVAQRLGTLSLGARGTGGEQLFLGVARADDVFAYLDGVPYDVVAEATPDTVALRPVPGRATPRPPQGESFWVASAVGTSPEVQWPTGGGDLRYVVMRADGSAPVSARLVLGFASDTVFPVSVGLLVAGGLLIVAGIVLLVVVVRGRGRRAGTAAPVVTGTAPPPG